MDEQQQRVKDWMARYGLGTDPQARMLDLRSRHAPFEEKAPEDITAEAVDMITSFIEIR